MSNKPINSVLSEKPWKNYFFQGFFFIFLLWLTLPAFYFPIAAHSDANIRLMLNHFWAYDWQSFEQLIFSQGPLAFLQYPLPIKNNLLLGQIIGLIARTFLLMGLWILNPKTGPLKFITSGAAFLAINCLAGHHLIFLAVVLISTLAALRKNSNWLILAVIWATINWHIRLAPGLIGLVIVGLGFMLLLSQTPKNKPLWPLAMFWVLLFFLTTLLYKTSLSQINDLFLGYYHLIFNSPSLIAGQPASKVTILSSLGACALFALALKRRSLKALGLPIILILFLTAFYFISRPGQGPYLVLLRVAGFCGVLLFLVQVLNVRQASGVILGLFILGAVGFKAFNLNTWPYTKLRPIRASQQLLNPQPYQVEWEKNMADWQIPLTELSCSTVVVYPWHFIPFYQSGFKLKAVPSLQGYLGHTPYLDSLNSVYLKSLPANSCLLTHPFDLNLATTKNHINNPFTTQPSLTAKIISEQYKPFTKMPSGHLLHRKN